VQRVQPGQHVDEHAEHGLERRRRRGRSELAPSHAVDEVGHDQHFVGSDQDVAYARHVRVVERLEATCVADPVGDVAVVERATLGAVGHDETRAALGACVERRPRRDALRAEGPEEPQALGGFLPACVCLRVRRRESGHVTIRLPSTQGHRSSEHMSLRPRRVLPS
jgi:hypothetical protein